MGEQGPVAWPLLIEGSGLDSGVYLDFGKEVGGITTLQIGAMSGAQSVSLGLAWSESTYYVKSGDDSNGGSGHDGYLSTKPYGNITAKSSWTVPANKLRGGFRYLHVFIESAPASASLELANVTLAFTAAPRYPDPSAYKGSFQCSDDLVNRVWYGAAYTAQLCTIDPKQGRVWGPPPSGWDNSAVCGVGESVIVDGAKRDRVIWPGDMGVSSLVLSVTIGDVYSAEQSINTIFPMQDASGMLPYAGPPVNFKGNSDMYHLWALIGALNTFDANGNLTFAQTHYAVFQKAVTCSLNKLQAVKGSSDKLMYVDKRADWQRGDQGGQNIAANSALYAVLVRGSKLAATLNQTQDSSTWAQQAAALKTAINAQLWDAGKRAYKDNPTSKIYPQDGNSLAVWFGVTDAAKSAEVSDYLRSNWGEFGSSSPEWGGNIGTFAGSMEANAHATMGNATRVLAMARLQWGYMINNPNSTQSTFWEGYNKDGTFNFRGIYMSNSHGWATGIASALSLRVLGLRARHHDVATPASSVVRDGDQFDYIVDPNPGGLLFCEGRLPMPGGGAVAMRWAFDSPTRDILTVLVDSNDFPNGRGVLRVSRGILQEENGLSVTVSLDDEDNSNYTGAPQVARVVGQGQRMDGTPQTHFDIPHAGSGKIVKFVIARRV